MDVLIILNLPSFEFPLNNKSQMIELKSIDPSENEFLSYDPRHSQICDNSCRKSRLSIVSRTAGLERGSVSFHLLSSLSMVVLRPEQALHPPPSPVGALLLSRVSRLRVTSSYSWSVRALVRALAPTSSPLHTETHADQISSWLKISPTFSITSSIVDTFHGTTYLYRIYSLKYYYSAICCFSVCILSMYSTAVK